MPDEPSRKSISEEWFLRGENDLQSAGLLFQQGGPTDTIGCQVSPAEAACQGQSLEFREHLKTINSSPSL